jgi:hypothetical protein
MRIFSEKICVMPELIDGCKPAPVVSIAESKWEIGARENDSLAPVREYSHEHFLGNCLLKNTYPFINISRRVEWFQRRIDL